MARKTVITREAVEDAAFEIVRREGATALSARRIGEFLGCSTQPIYTACGSMDSVMAAVGERTRTLFERALAPDGSDIPALLRLGFATLDLAKNEPHLFRLASEHMAEQVGQPPPRNVLAAMKADPELGALSAAELTELHTLLWIFSHGLATLLGSRSSPLTITTARRALRVAGEAIVEHALRRAGSSSPPHRRGDSK